MTNFTGRPVDVFHNRNPSNLDSSDQRIRLFCDLNLDYESVDLPLKVDQRIQSPWITGGAAIRGGQQFANFYCTSFKTNIYVEY